MKYNDSYAHEHVDLFGNGESWEIVEGSHHILQNQRKFLGLTQQQVADAAHIQLRQYQRLESGERSMLAASMRIGLSICAALKLDPFRFIHLQLK